MVGAEILNYTDIDIGVKGEGEKTIVELLKTIDGQKEFDCILDIIYRKDGQIIKSASREFIKDLDSLCFPHESAKNALKDYEKYPVEFYKRKGKSLLF